MQLFRYYIHKILISLTRLNFDVKIESEILERALERGVEVLWIDLVLSRYVNDEIDGFYRHWRNLPDGASLKITQEDRSEALIKNQNNSSSVRSSSASSFNTPGSAGAASA